MNGHQDPSTFGVTIIPRLGSLFILILVMKWLCVWGGELVFLESSAFSPQALASARSVKQVPWLELQPKTPMPLSES